MLKCLAKNPWEFETKRASMKIYDSKSKQKVPLVPIKEKEVRIYVCGPTVYDDAHLGHARSSIVFDLLRRTLNLSGYKTTLVKNFTDIDDKIIHKSLNHQIPLEEVTQTYIHSYIHDMDRLNVLPPDIHPKATQSLGAIISFVERLLHRGHAYQSENGDVYLDVKKDPLYGSLSQRGVDDENQSRIQENKEKKDPRDFVLWKTYKGEDDIGYESPFGFGRPGWHIECSAMIDEHLAYKDEDFCIDIHGGGADLLFPHHENEASQTRCAYDSELAKYWMHNEMVHINGEKMSKSLGNSFFVKDALKFHDGEILRNYLLTTHYRAILHFNEEDLLMSKKRLDKIYRLKKRALPVQGVRDGDFEERLLHPMQDDLNISQTLSVLDEFLAHANQSLDQNPKDKALHANIISNLAFIEALLGIGGKDGKVYFQLGVSEEKVKWIEEKIHERKNAKKEKNYVLADEIRQELHEEGIAIMDTAEGTVWENTAKS
ncbi:cysteinyl-tRNA synthetase [Helicobacter mustelae]|nr:cysteinyl-tRNA synthetase [Helicobacter mustelae]